MRNVLHQKGWLYGTVQIYVYPLPIPLIKLILIQSWRKITSKLNCAEILCWRHMICMISKWPCLIILSQRSFFYLNVIIRWSSKYQGVSLQVKTYSNFVLYYVDKIHVNYKRSVKILVILILHIWIRLYWI